MKKIILVTILLIAVSLTMQSQTFVNRGGSELTHTNLFCPIDIIKVSDWSAFAADSSATVYSATFDISKYDSLDCWVRATSVLGSPNFYIALLGAFDNINFTSASLGQIADSTSVLTEVLTHSSYGALTKGTTVGKLKLVPSVLGATTFNRKDDIINLIIVGHRRTQ